MEPWGQPSGVAVKFGTLCFCDLGSQVQIPDTDLHHLLATLQQQPTYKVEEDWKRSYQLRANLPQHKKY